MFKRVQDFATIKTYPEAGKRHGINQVILFEMAIRSEVMRLEQIHPATSKKGHA